MFKIAWSRFGSVRMSDIDEQTMAFEFESERDKEQILDQSLWSVHGNFLNLTTCKSNSFMEEMDFNTMQIWIQVYGLSMDMYNKENAYRIGNGKMYICGT